MCYSCNQFGSFNCFDCEGDPSNCKRCLPGYRLGDADQFEYPN